MRKQELLNLFEDNLELIIETCPIMKSSTELLNMDLIDKYFRKKGIYINNENISFLLEVSGITYIEVILNKNSIVVESPGQLIEKNKSGKNENYIKRNMWIYEKLISLDDRNIFLNNGRGFKRIRAAFKGKARIKFVNSKSDNSFKVILPGIFTSR